MNASQNNHLPNINRNQSGRIYPSFYTGSSQNEAYQNQSFESYRNQGHLNKPNLPNTTEISMNHNFGQLRPYSQPHSYPHRENLHNQELNNIQRVGIRQNNQQRARSWANGAQMGASSRIDNSQARSASSQANHPSPRSASNYAREAVINVEVSSMNLGKMDGIFAQCYKSRKLEHIMQTLIVLGLLLALLLLYKFKVFKGIDGYQFGFNEEEGLKFSLIPFIIAFQSITVFGLLHLLISGFSSLQFALQTALKINCSSIVEPADLKRSFDENISTMYLSVETQVSYDLGMDDFIKKRLLEQTENKIMVNVKNYFCCTYQLVEISRFGMFIFAIVLIVALAQGHTSRIEKCLLIITIVYWMLKNYRKIFYIGLALLCPLFTVGVLIYFCFCNGKKQVQIPEARNPTQQEILNSGGTCAICMMDFERSDKIVTLPCSDKHMFHQICINGWLSVKTTCPNCRFDLAS